jgi:hypothetical protein
MCCGVPDDQPGLLDSAWGHVVWRRKGRSLHVLFQELQRVSGTPPLYAVVGQDRVRRPEHGVDQDAHPRRDAALRTAAGSQIPSVSGRTRTWRTRAARPPRRAASLRRGGEPSSSDDGVRSLDATGGFGPLLEDGARDDQALYLAGALVDLRHPGIPVVALDGMVLHVSVTA